MESMLRPVGCMLKRPRPSYLKYFNGGKESCEIMYVKSAGKDDNRGLL